MTKPGPGTGKAVRERLRRVMEALSAEDLEERVAPVKCGKHPDAPECGDLYGVPRYAVPPAPESPD